MSYLSIFHRCAADKRCRISPRNAEFSRFKSVGFHGPVDEFRYPRRCGCRDFVKPVVTVDDEGVVAAEVVKHVCVCFGEFWRVNAEDLCLRAGRVGKRPDGIENRADADFAARPDSVFHRAVQHRCEKKPDANFIDAPSDVFRFNFNVHAECCEDVRAAALARHAAVTVFGYRHTCTRDDKGGSG